MPTNNQILCLQVNFKEIRSGTQKQAYWYFLHVYYKLYELVFSLVYELSSLPSLLNATMPLSSLLISLSINY